MTGERTIEVSDHAIPAARGSGTRRPPPGPERTGSRPKHGPGTRARYTQRSRTVIGLSIMSNTLRYAATMFWYPG